MGAGTDLCEPSDGCRHWITVDGADRLRCELGGDGEHSEPTRAGRGRRAQRADPCWPDLAPDHRGGVHHVRSGRPGGSPPTTATRPAGLTSSTCCRPLCGRQAQLDLLAGFLTGSRRRSRRLPQGTSRLTTQGSAGAFTRSFTSPSPSAHRARPPSPDRSRSRPPTAPRRPGSPRCSPVGSSRCTPGRRRRASGADAGGVGAVGA